jgi:hypothetical protein
MKRTILIISIFVMAVSQSCKEKSENASSARNEYVVALQKISSTFSNLSMVADSISAGLSETEKERAGYFLASAYSLVMESYLEKGDPAFPGLTEWMSPTRKFGGDNPYTIYTQAPVDQSFEYILKGKSGNAIYLGVQVYGYAQGFNLATANMGLSDIKTDADGSFTIYLSAVRPGNVLNWIPLTRGDHAFLIRQYFGDRNSIIPAQFELKRIDKNDNPGIHYLERMKMAEKMLYDYILGAIDINSLLRENAFNTYPSKEAQVRAPKYGGALYPTKDNKYEGCWVSLKPGEVLNVHGFLPKKTLYASYVFYDRWYNTPNYRKINSFRTMDEIVLNTDGSFDLYISPEKIDHPNWIDTGGLYEGSYSSRYMLSEETVFPDIKVINIMDVKKSVNE